MKKIVMIVAALFAACPTIRAAENPDKYPSVGFTYAEVHARDLGGGTFIASRPVLLDLRVPASDNVTLGFQGGPTTVGTSSRDVRQGYVLGFSARVYLPFRLIRD